MAPGKHCIRQGLLRTHLANRVSVEAFEAGDQKIFDIISEKYTETDGVQTIDRLFLTEEAVSDLYARLGKLLGK